MADLKQLMERYCDGDASALRELYARLAPSLLGRLLEMTHDRDRAQALLHRTFESLHRSRRAYVRGADPVPWIYAIAMQRL